ncbi:hypothetical protein H8699_03340 [Christensenellaceae bacterium NSJ-44]|uniref:Uncharacterized protein n=1 Tax=Luoshenia tenuis TaxID=2763654 RepID=A0A926HLG9_9FIRM|nr:hypothetical protein [Luoshenia tenuis]MBC8528469.1 hypothetical protein [Luoshenia tenuis]
MKKLVLLFLIMIVSFLSACTGCHYEGKAPLDYENSVWVCNEVDIIYDVDNKENNRIVFNGHSIKFYFMYGWKSDRLAANEIVTSEPETESNAKTIKELLSTEESAPTGESIVLFNGQFIMHGDDTFDVNVNDIFDERLSGLPQKLTFCRKR